MIRATSALALLAVAPAAQPSVVDVDFVMGLSSFGSPTALTVGEAPDSLAALVPSDVEVLGTLSGGGMGGSLYLRIVGRTDNAPDAVISSVRAQPGPGWSVRLNPRAEKPTSGFVDTTDDPDATVLLARGDEPDLAAVVLASPRPAGGSYVLISVQEPHPYLVDQSWGSERPPTVLQHVPALTEPEGSRMIGGSGGGSEEDYVDRARLESDLAPGDLLAHYDALMGAGGWRLLASDLEDDSAVGVWSRTVEADALLATFRARREGGSYDMVLSVVGPER